MKNHDRIKKILKRAVLTGLAAVSLAALVACEPKTPPDVSGVPSDTTVGAHEHDWETTRMEPTCVENGFSWSFCTICHEVINEILPAVGHDYVRMEEVAPTCTKDGYTAFLCSRCRDLQKRDVTAALGHAYTIEQVVAPTYVEQGYTLHTCERCGDSYKDSFVPMLSSSVTVWYYPEGGVLAEHPFYQYRVGQTVELTGVTREGYVFDGWYDEEGRRYENGVWDRPVDTALYAQWQPLSFKLRLDAGVGELSMQEATVYYDGSYGFLPDPKPPFGYEFLGWYDGDMPVTDESVYTHLEDGMLVARWKAPTASGSCGEDLRFVVCADGVTRFEGTGTVILGGVLAGRTDVVKVEIPDTVTRLDAGAFAGCTELTEIALPASIELIRSETFKGCTKLEKVTIAKGIGAINMQAFSGCTSLRELTVPTSVLQMYDPFAGCTALTDIYYDGSAFMWSCIIKDPEAEAFFKGGQVTVHYAK